MGSHEEDSSDESPEGNVASDQPSCSGLADESVAPKKKTISCIQCRRRKLKCDRVKPSCGTCSRLQHQCIYPAGRMKSTAKRRNVKDLEARLAQVESLLSSEVASKALKKEQMPTKSDTSPPTDPLSYWDGITMDMGLGDAGANLNSLPEMSMPLMDDNPFSFDLIGFGMEEQLPSQDLIDELHKIYFERVHPMLPMLQRYRYLASVTLPLPLGPPLCLRYGVWAVAASVSKKYTKIQEIFYQRARKYAEADEMKAPGEQFISVAHAQTWWHISNYEAENMLLARAWISAGRCIRLVQMMNLHRLDGDTENFKQMIPPPRDWSELEERRRTFWAAFCCDRYSCAGTGWPMAIEEKDILTNLPASEEAYERGQPEDTPSLLSAMTTPGASRISAFAGQLLMACLFGHNWIHLHRPGLNDHPEDMNGAFWKRHRQMDNVISNIFMFLPEHLRLPAGIRDMKIICLNMNIHCTIICLHQAAILKAEKHGLDPQIILQSQARCTVAAEEIVNIMRMISHVDVAQLNVWMSFNLYVAAGVLIEGCSTSSTGQQSSNNLEFLLKSMQAMGRMGVVSQSFVTQLEFDLDAAGISTFQPKVGETNRRNLRAWGPPSIYSTRSARSRISELPEFLQQSMWINAGRGSGSTESSGTSTKNSPTPPPDTRNMPTMEGVFPMQQRLNLRVRQRQEAQNQNNAFDMSTNQTVSMIADSSQQIHDRSSAKTIEELSFPPQFAYSQQVLNNEGNSFDKQKGFGTLVSTDQVDGLPSDWNFDALASGDFSGLSFSLDGEEDLNSAMNDATWDAALFNRR